MLLASWQFYSVETEAFKVCSPDATKTGFDVGTIFHVAVITVGAGEIFGS